ncbi:MAG: thermonuclease family protein, partial [Planctomycetes bacterium]|nr:thermonuclease family protein [Planctomycetota bacterium]
MKVTRRAADRRDVIEGVLPGRVSDLGHGYVVRVSVEGSLFCEASITRVRPVWSDTRKLILDRFVHFHEVVEFEAERVARLGNTQVSRAYMNRTVSQIARDAINSALGDVHYLVDHSAYPDGAVREYSKFSARKNSGNELEVGGIAVGQWVDSSRMDLTGAFAKDGDTIAGLKVDGADWPDLRLMLVDSEETSKNSHAAKLHPEVAGWTTARYDASGYKLAGDRAKVFLQDLIDSKGIDFIELNPHRDSTGAFDDRVDAFGRYLGLVYGGGECFNAALVEQGHASVLLFEGGKFLVPELELKDFFSYAGVNSDSIEESPQTLSAYDVTNGVYEVLTALAYAADGFVWSVAPDLAVSFRRASRPDRAVFFDPVLHGVRLGSDSGAMGNEVFFDGNPFTTAFSKTYVDSASIDEYGFSAKFFEYFSISVEADADRLVN